MGGDKIEIKWFKGISILSMLTSTDYYAVMGLWVLVPFKIFLLGRKLEFLKVTLI